MFDFKRKYRIFIRTIVVAATTITFFIPYKGIGCYHEPCKEFIFMKLIPLTQGQFAQVDDEDYDHLMQVKWFANKSRTTYYAKRNIIKLDPKTGEYKKHTIAMQHVIMGIETLIDHKDHDGLNNQRDNLRICSNMQNVHNCQKRTIPNVTSKYKGVNWNKRQKRWVARIGVNNKRIALGNFFFEQNAAIAFNEAALKYHGEFAFLNEIDSPIISEPTTNNTSYYRGVHWDKKKRLWKSQINVKNKRYYLGRHKKENDAATAYNLAATKYFGEQAKLNIL